MAEQQGDNKKYKWLKFRKAIILLKEVPIKVYW